MESKGPLFQQITGKLLLLFILLLYAKNVVFASPQPQPNPTEKKMLFSTNRDVKNSMVANTETEHSIVNVKYYLTPTPQNIIPTIPKASRTFPVTGNTVDLARSVAKEIGINEDTFLCVIQKESGFNSRRPDGSLKCGDNGLSCGLGQIQLPTWMSIRRHAGWSQDDLRADDYENLKTTAYGLKNGWKYHWSAYRYCESQGYTL